MIKHKWFLSSDVLPKPMEDILFMDKYGKCHDGYLSEYDSEGNQFAYTQGGCLGISESLAWCYNIFDVSKTK